VPFRIGEFSGSPREITSYTAFCFGPGARWIGGSIRGKRWPEGSRATAIRRRMGLCASDVAFPAHSSLDLLVLGAGIVCRTLNGH